MVSSGEIPAVTAAVHHSGYPQAFLTPLPPKNLLGTSFTSVPTAGVEDFCAFKRISVLFKVVLTQPSFP